MTRLWPNGEAVEAWGGIETLEGFFWQGTSHHISIVCNRWRIHTRWWDAANGLYPGQAIWREYLKITTDQELLCLLYRDLQEESWFLARVYD